MHKKGQKRKRDTGQRNAQMGLFAKKSRTSSELKELDMSVVAGYLHTFLYIKVDGEDKLYASGRNTLGQLGLGDDTDRKKWTDVPSPKEFEIEKVIAGGVHSFLKGKGKDVEDKLYACGRNFEGQLGVGVKGNRKKWTEVSIPKDFKIEKVIAGAAHSFLKGKDAEGKDKLYASGYNYYGQLGLGDNNNRREWTEVPMPQGFSLEEVIVGGDHSFLKGKGKNGEDKFYGCGHNGVGQLGLGDFNDRREWTEIDIPQGFSVEKVMAGDYHSFLKGKGKDGNDKLYACGRNFEGQLGLGDNEHRNQWTEVDIPQGFSVEKLIAGRENSFLKGKGKDGKDKLYACGNNSFGQLGLGHRRYRNIWTEVPVPQGFSVEKVMVGLHHSFLKGKGKDGEDKLYACGWNYYGQLGLGDNNNRREWTEVPIADLLKKSQEDVNDRKKDGDVLEDSGSSGSSTGLNPRDYMF
ncbi:MAG TPA: hypothetical protein QF353_04120 [Gammaproteobacteria bacterium]|nr:hypothetical protein [Gammaproteobacteria bacterium]